ncbi:alpha-2-macroglobulin-like protein 1 [Engystomops pustulosus]|uniref:alpha-2-macroglobulin-like protein 1 n=1 Tax=Engystomops pustulosus TaxID=76066 RepID=UPI003AFB74F5
MSAGFPGLNTDKGMDIIDNVTALWISQRTEEEGLSPTQGITIQNLKTQKMTISGCTGSLRLLRFLLGLLLLPSVPGDPTMQPDINYMLLIPAELHFPSSENVCLLLDGEIPKDFTVTATLETQQQEIQLLPNQPKNGFFCFSFTVPSPSAGNEVATVKIVGKGLVSFEESKQLLIKTLPGGVVVQTDKAIYRASETVRFRIVTLDKNFMCSRLKYSVVELKVSHGGDFTYFTFFLRTLKITGSFNGWM